MTAIPNLNSFPSRILEIGDARLREPCNLVTTPNLQLLADVSALMMVSMQEARGVGLAGNQIGLMQRIVVIGDQARIPVGTDPALFRAQGRDAFEPLTLINPVITPDGDAGQATWFEGCLSIPGYTAAVPRWKKVTVTYSDLLGKAHELTASGWLARILQHECNHLDGVLYVDKMITRSFMSKTQYVRTYRDLRVADYLEALELLLSS